MKKLLVILIILIFSLLILKKYYTREVQEITYKERRNNLQEKIHTFEDKLAQWYPLNEHESFIIKHGGDFMSPNPDFMSPNWEFMSQNRDFMSPNRDFMSPNPGFGSQGDYFKFFDRLGQTQTNIVYNSNKEIVGTGTGILRKIKEKASDTQLTQAWYICDLKVLPEYRGNYYPFKMLLKSWTNIFQSKKIYGIGMGNAEKIEKLSKFIPLLHFKNCGKLNIYSIDGPTLIRILPIIKKHRGTPNYLSLKGQKDLILKSTGQPYKLLHLQFPSFSPDLNPSNKQNLNKQSSNKLLYPKPLKGYQYMFCCHEQDSLNLELINNGIHTDIYATIIAANMERCDWRFVLTSDI